MLYDVGNFPAGNCGRIIGKRIYTASIAIAIPAAADAERDANRTTLPAFHFIGERKHDTRTGTADRMADGNG